MSIDAPSDAREHHHREVRQRIHALLEGEDDWVAAMATVACELHGSFAYYNWTGFYRVVGHDMLVIGPYQGSHGCLRIPFSRGVCGAAARTLQTQRVADVEQISDHIACSATTRSELVIPIVAPNGRLFAVLDIDSDLPDAFSAVDQRALESLCSELGQRFGDIQNPRVS